jgi:hypothetical protein
MKVSCFTSHLAGDPFINHHQTQMAPAGAPPEGLTITLPYPPSPNGQVGQSQWRRGPPSSVPSAWARRDSSAAGAAKIWLESALGRNTGRSPRCRLQPALHHGGVLLSKPSNFRTLLKRGMQKYTAVAFINLSANPLFLLTALDLTVAALGR